MDNLETMSGISNDYGYIASGSELGSDMGRILPRQISTGSTRGTQTVGYGRTKIDGSNNTITLGDSITLNGDDSIINVANTDNSQLGLGAIPGSTTNEFGFYAVSAAGKLIFKIVNGTLFMFDANTGNNTLQMGLLSNGTTNLAIARPGGDVQIALNS